MRDVLDGRREGVLVILGGVGLQDLEGDRAGLELEALGSLGLNEAVPAGVGDGGVVLPVVVAQTVDGDLTVGVGRVGRGTGGAQLLVQGRVDGLEVRGRGGLRRALVDLELGALSLVAGSLAETLVIFTLPNLETTSEFG